MPNCVLSKPGHSRGTEREGDYVRSVPLSKPFVVKVIQGQLNTSFFKPEEDQSDLTHFPVDPRTVDASLRMDRCVFSDAKTLISEVTRIASGTVLPERYRITAFIAKRWNGVCVTELASLEFSYAELRRMKE